ncbi:MAG: hypothetical protein LBQ87_09095 [Candidatus Fibromonas sp.]|jgi:hypothetical protein|nr:hypothetical protein [Candidatus Fibromonas sp.]
MARQARTYWLSNNLYSYEYVLLLPIANAKIESAFTARLNGRRGCVVTGKEAEQLVVLYSLYEFSSNIIVGSLDEPYGCKLRNIPADEETIINDIILGGMNGTRP